MISKSDVDNLARLARIDISEEENVRLQKDLESILGYVSELTAAAGDVSPQGKDELVNAMRSDDIAHEPGAFSDEILAAAPKSEDGYVVVRQIIER